MDPANLERCQEIIGYQFRQVQLLQQALTHSSACSARTDSNERMEFLGDAVLGLVICQEIFSREGDLPEGEMTKIKSAVVSRETCAAVSNECGLTNMLILGKGITLSSQLPSSLAAALLESVIGAMYLDGGLEVARQFILKQMGPPMAQAMASEHQHNFKSLLQQYAQRKFGDTPQYDLLDEKGPEHAKCFEMAVRLNGRQFASAWGNSKKQAEQKAALAALVELGTVDASELDAEIADQ